MKTKQITPYMKYQNGIDYAKKCVQNFKSIEPYQQYWLTYESIVDDFKAGDVTVLVRVSQITPRLIIFERMDTEGKSFAFNASELTQALDEGRLKEVTA